ncbi:MAG: nitrilase-related carbon-nitrogen hydrolase [Patescibacteria group bacterium]
MIWLLPIISAFLLDLSFEHFYLSFLGLFGLIPFFIFIERICFAGRDKTVLKKSFLGGWLAGFIFFALISRWLFSALPADWAGLNNIFLANLIFVSGWLMLSIFVGISFGIFGFSASLFLNYYQKSSNFLNIIIIPSIWIISEYLRAWMFSLLTWSPSASFAPHWSFGNLGYTLIDTLFIFGSRFVGLYGISFFAVFFNTALFILFFRRRSLFLSAIFVLILVPVILSPAFFAPNSFLENKEFLNIAFFQMNTKLKPMSISKIFLLWDRAESEKRNISQPDMLIFPENGYLGFIGEKEKEFIKKVFPDQNRQGLIITNRVVVEKNGLLQGQIIYRDQKGDIVDVQVKSFLIPGGEFMPSILKFFLVLTNNQAALQRFEVLRSFSNGKTFEKPVEFSLTSVGALLCSGVVSPLLYRSLAKQGAQILVNSASLGIFNNDPFLLSQLKTQARFQAIANEKPFIQSTDGGQSLFIDQNGKMIIETKPSENSILFAKVFPSKIQTFYTKFGDWPLIMAFLILLLGFKRLIYEVGPHKD